MLARIDLCTVFSRKVTSKSDGSVLALKEREETFGTTRHGEESGPKWRGVGMVQTVSRLCAVPSGAKADEPLQTRREERHERVRNVVEKSSSNLEEEKRWKLEGKRKTHKERVQEAKGGI